MRFVVDIDGVIFDSVCDLYGNYQVRAVNDSVVDRIKLLYASGHEIVLHTGRHWNHMDLTIKQLKQHGVDYHTLVMGKPVGDFYIDDRIMSIDQFVQFKEAEDE